MCFVKKRMTLVCSASVRVPCDRVKPTLWSAIRSPSSVWRLKAPDKPQLHTCVIDLGSNRDSRQPGHTSVAFWGSFSLWVASNTTSPARTLPSHGDMYACLCVVRAHREHSHGQASSQRIYDTDADPLVQCLLVLKEHWKWTKRKHEACRIRTCTCISDPNHAMLPYRCGGRIRNNLPHSSCHRCIWPT